MITRRELLQYTAATAAVAAVGRAAGAEAQAADAPLFPGFKSAKIKTSGATLNLVSGGKGSPVLLMHGYPQTHVLWHKIAPKLAEKFYVVAADLRGYGDGMKPLSTHWLTSAPNHSLGSSRPNPFFLQAS